MNRQIVLDTETTGLEPQSGHRIIEIGCVEIINRKITDKRFHVYLNPQRDIEDGAADVHGIKLADLADKPKFMEVAEEFLQFVRGAELIIHNAPFDVGFLNMELALCGREPIESECQITDTLLLAREQFPGQRNSLDALCRRFEIDNSHRNLHGALLDAEILCEVYLVMTGGQGALAFDEHEFEHFSQTPYRLPAGRQPLPVYAASAEELSAHAAYLEVLDKSSGGCCVWKQIH